MPIKSYSHLLNFYSTLNQHGGPISTNRFVFILGSYPTVLGGGGPYNRPSQAKYSLKGNSYLRSLRYLCENIDFPGLTINVDPRPGYSPKMVTKMPGTLEYGSLTATFIVRDRMTEKELFDDWIFAIKNAFSSSNPGATFDNAYMNDIVIDATLFVMSPYNTMTDTIPQNQTNNNGSIDFTEVDTTEIRYAIVFRDLYPISVDQINLNWQSDEAMKFQVNFTYSYWEPIVGAAAWTNLKGEEMVSHTTIPQRHFSDLTERPVVNFSAVPTSNTGIQ